MQTAFLLIALGFGFKIFAEASANAKKSVRQLGRLVGIVIMLVSFLGTLCGITCAVRYGKMYCPFGGKTSMWGGSKMCPITGKSLTQEVSIEQKNK